MLLQAPTGSGKTLMLGRTIEGIIGKLPMKCVWFWFAPYSGLVTQTLDSLAEQLRTQYVLGFYSTNEKRDGSFRKLRVRIKKPGYTARARTGYYSPKD